jgi:phosphoglycerate kinase
MIKSIQDLDLDNKTVLLRVDLNAPIKDGTITDNTRIVRALTTINYLKSRSAKIIILSHLGRPDTQPEQNLSLSPIAREIKKLIPNATVKFAEDCIGQKASEEAASISGGDILLLENLRFHKGETQNDENFARTLAKLGEIYINDAFACSHRAHASLVKLPKLLPAAAGFLFLEEIKQIDNVLDNAQTPMMAIVGGGKISTKIDLLKKLASSVDYLVVGGAIANCFLRCQGFNIGQSLYDKNKHNDTLNILQIAEDNSCQIVLPMDVIITDNQNTKYPECSVCSLGDIPMNGIISDIGPNSISKINQIMENCKTVLWNGPLGICNNLSSSVGTAAVAQNIALLTSQGKIRSLAGGGDSIEIINKLGLQERYTYISTGGGAFLKYIDNKSLVGLEALKP